MTNSLRAASIAFAHFKGKINTGPDAFSNIDTPFGPGYRSEYLLSAKAILDNAAAANSVAVMNTLFIFNPTICYDSPDFFGGLGGLGGFGVMFLTFPVFGSYSKIFPPGVPR